LHLRRSCRGHTPSGWQGSLTPSVLQIVPKSSRGSTATWPPRMRRPLFLPSLLGWGGVF
jgi:hypothetical protein